MVEDAAAAVLAGPAEVAPAPFSVEAPPPPLRGPISGVALPSGAEDSAAFGSASSWLSWLRLYWAVCTHWQCKLSSTVQACICEKSGVSAITYLKITK